MCCSDLALEVHRLPDTVRQPTTIESEPGGFRSLARIHGPLPRPPADSAVVDASGGDDANGGANAAAEPAVPPEVAVASEIGS